MSTERLLLHSKIQNFQNCSRKRWNCFEWFDLCQMKKEKDFVQCLIDLMSSRPDCGNRLVRPWNGTWSSALQHLCYDHKQNKSANFHGSKLHTSRDPLSPRLSLRFSSLIFVFSFNKWKIYSPWTSDTRRITPMVSSERIFMLKRFLKWPCQTWGKL